MTTPTLEEIKRRKLEEMTTQQSMQQMQERAQIQKQVEQLEGVVKQILTKDALERYGNLKTAHPEKAIQILVVLGNAMQQGQIKGRIDDASLKNILKQLTQEQKEFKIKRV